MKIEQGAGAPKRPTGSNGIDQKKIMMMVAIGVVAVALIVAGIFLVKNLSGGKENTSSTESTTDETPSSTDTETVSSEEPIPTEPEVEIDPETGVALTFSEQYKANPDFRGHISIPNTLLASDVAQGSTEKDKFLYLDKNLQKEHDPYGVPFIDWRASMGVGYQSAILTIYGHNSKNGDYFESVKNYKDIEYYKNNPLVEFDTIYGKGTYKIIGRFTVNVNYQNFPKEDVPFNYHDYYDLDEKYYKAYMDYLDQVNYYDSGIDVKYGDNFLVLSTCNDEIQGPKNTPYRDVLIARKVRVGEDATVDVSKIQPNKDMKMPIGWQKKFGKENPYK